MRKWHERDSTVELKMLYSRSEHSQVGLFRRDCMLVQAEDGPKGRVQGDGEKLNQSLINQCIVLNGHWGLTGYLPYFSVY